jgi:hypothetical protein
MQSELLTEQRENQSGLSVAIEWLVTPHPSDKNKYVARMGHPAFPLHLTLGNDQFSATIFSFAPVTPG